MEARDSQCDSREEEKKMQRALETSCRHPTTKQTNKQINGEKKKM